MSTTDVRSTGATTALRWLQHARIPQLGAWALARLGSGSPPAPQPPLTQNRDLDAFRALATEPNSEILVIFLATQQFLAGHREWDGVDYFGKLASEQPARRGLFLSLQGLM